MDTRYSKIEALKQEILDGIIKKGYFSKDSVKKRVREIIQNELGNFYSRYEEQEVMDQIDNFLQKNNVNWIGAAFTIDKLDEYYYDGKKQISSVFQLVDEFKLR